MQNGYLALAAAALTLGATSLYAADLVPRQGAAMIFLGQTHAQHLHDHDTIVLTGRGNSFRTLRVQVRDAPLRLQRMRVTYDRGMPEDIRVHATIPKNSFSREITLHHNRRAVRQVDFWYDTKGWLRGSADVTLYGSR